MPRNTLLRAGAASILAIASVPADAFAGAADGAPAPASTSVLTGSPEALGTGVVVARPAFDVHADGRGDDTAVLQKAIDAAGGRGGVVFLPSGTYRVADTLKVPKGVRLYGVGPRRPTLRLAASTPGWGGAGRAKYVVSFLPQEGRKGNDTFYSGVDNVDVEIGAGNPDAVGVHFDVAQGCVLRNMDFRLAPGTVGVGYAANEIFRCRFYGGAVAVRAPNNVAWQSLLLECTFEGQSEAAIRADSSGVTVVRGVFRRVPRAVEVPAGRVEQLFLGDCRFEEVSDAAVVTDASPSPANYAHLQKAACDRTPVLLRLRSGEPVATPGGAARWTADTVSYGVNLGGGAGRGTVTEGIRAVERLPAPPRSDVPDLPPMARWVSVRALGAKGDGKSDDTAALRAAFARHRVLFFPPGSYRVTDTLTLRPDTVLIGLQPRAARFVLAARTPGFTDPARPRALLETPPGGTCQVRGLGFSQGENPGSVGVRWRAGDGSLFDDAYFDYAAAGLSSLKGTGQLHGLWIGDGGGGTFKNLWSPNDLATTGLTITDTATPGRVYVASIEHHRGVEIQMRRVRNWRFYALQTEGNEAVGIDMADCRDLEFVNTYLYRTSAGRENDLRGVRMERCANVAFRGLHSFSLSRFPYATTLWHAGSPPLAVTERSLASAFVPPAP